MRTITSMFSIGLLAAPVLAIGCSTWPGPPDGHVVGTGEVVQVPLTVADFHGIEVEGAMDVELTQSEQRSVTVEAQANIAALVTVEVKGGIWHLGTKEGYTTTKNFVVRVSLPSIDVLSVSGSGDVKGQGTFTMNDLKLETAGSGNISLDIAAKRVWTATSGSGDMKLAGTCGDLKVSVTGSGDVNAKALRSQQVAVDVMGSGDVVVNASEELAASVAGSGTVSYLGSPEHRTENVSGSGRIVALERKQGPR